MTKLSDNFDRSEFACRCGCGFDTVDAELLRILERIRDFFEQPVRITSGCRCAEHNRAVGGGSKSQHLYGRAADIQVRSIPPGIVQEYCMQLGVPGLGCYKTFTHIDTRTGHARWAG